VHSTKADKVADESQPCGTNAITNEDAKSKTPTRSPTRTTPTKTPTKTPRHQRYRQRGRQTKAPTRSLNEDANQGTNQYTGQRYRMGSQLKPDLLYRKFDALVAALTCNSSVVATVFYWTTRK
jgi:hypothetical protein